MPSSHTAPRQTINMGGRPMSDLQNAIKPLATFVANPLQRYAKSKPKYNVQSQSSASSAKPLLHNPFALLSSKTEENGSTSSLNFGLFGKDSVNSLCNDPKSQMDYSNFGGFKATNFASKNGENGNLDEIIEAIDGNPAMGLSQGQQLQIPTTIVG